MSTTTVSASGSGGSISASALRFWRLPAGDLDQLAGVVRDAHRVELKFVVPQPAHHLACATLGVDFRHASERHVFFLDTADLALYRHGVVVRLRSIRHQPDDSVVKLRPVAPADLPPRLWRHRQFLVDVDALPGSIVCAGTLKRRLGRGDVQYAMSGELPLRRLFSRRQLALLATRTPRPVRVDDLDVFGPMTVHRSKVYSRGLGRALAVERWLFPDGSAILEVSARVPPPDAAAVAARMAGVLSAYRVESAGPQATKTAATLAYFAATGPRSFVG